MSLTSQLYGGELSEWCADRLANTRMFCDTIAAIGRRHRPVRPHGQAAGNHWSTVGGSFGQRLAFLVEQAPPYYALLGAINAGLVSYSAANQAACRWPTHADLPADQRPRALELRPTPSGWLDLGRPLITTPAGPAEDVVDDLQTRTARYLAEHAPAGTLGRSPGAEAGLARVCWVLSGLEDAYRSGQLPTELADLFTAAPAPTVDQLRAAAPEHIVAELVELAALFRDSGSLAEFHRLAGHPAAGIQLGTAAPAIVPDWADADLLLGSTLIDVKTVLRLDKPERTARWLWQLAAYAWLDVRDVYRIRSVGLYLARHGVVLTWNLQMFADHMLGGTGRAADARTEFLQVAERVIANEGGHPPGK